MNNKVTTLWAVLVLSALYGYPSCANDFCTRGGVREPVRSMPTASNACSFLVGEWHGTRDNGRSFTETWHPFVEDSSVAVRENLKTTHTILEIFPDQNKVIHLRIRRCGTGTKGDDGLDGVLDPSKSIPGHALSFAFKNNPERIASIMYVRVDMNKIAVSTEHEGTNVLESSSLTRIAPFQK